MIMSCIESRPSRYVSDNIKKLLEDAIKGDSTAQCLLGYAYRDGLAVSKDDTEAVKWFRASAEQGFATAQHELGTAYKNGHGVQQDDAEAIKWWLKAAEQGDSMAQCLMGFAYYHGQEVQKNYGEAVKWWREAAKQKEAGALFGLGLAFALGRGVPQNYLEAYKYANLSAAQDFKSAIELRDDLAEKLSPSQIAEGQRLAAQETNDILQDDPKRFGIPAEVRREVWRRDGGKCVQCGSRENLEYDHIIPVSKGGSNTVRNIELLCETCNRAKSDSIQ